MYSKSITLVHLPTKLPLKKLEKDPNLSTQKAHSRLFPVKIWMFPKMVVPNNHGFSY